MATGMPESTALAVVECPLNEIRAQLQVHRWRQQHGKPVNVRRLKQAIRERWAVPELVRPVEYPLFPAVTDEPNLASETFDDGIAAAVLGPLVAHLTR